MVSSKPLLSVLIPVYNTADYLDVCVESILCQGYQNIEIIFYNDGSTDSSDEICLSYQQRYPEIVSYHFQPSNHGISAARNFLKAQAQGDYIWFIDSDDFMLEGSIKTIVNIINTHNVDLIICDFLKDEKKHKTCFTGQGGSVSSDKNALISGVYQHNRLYLWNKVVKRCIYEEITSFPDGCVFEDIHITPHILLKTQRYYYVPRALVSYRTRFGSIVEKSRRKGEFNVKMNQDRMSSLEQAAVLTMEDHCLDEQSSFWVANFMARQYIKIFKLYKASHEPITLSLLDYRNIIEASSPLCFNKLLKAYLKKGRLIRWVKLYKAMRAAA